MRTLCAFMVLVLAAACPAQQTGNAPTVIRFSGAGAGKAPVTATFSLYDSQEGGAAIWQETQQLAPDVEGRYSVLLGTVNGGLPVDVFASGSARWLGVRFGNAAEGPRVMLVSVPYAMTSFDAASLGGRPAQDFVTRSEFESAMRAPRLESRISGLSGTLQSSSAISPQPDSPVTTQNFLPKFADGVGTLTNSNFFDNGTSLGFGTTTPGYANLGLPTFTLFSATSAAMELASGRTSSGQTSVFYWIATGSSSTDKRIAFMDTFVNTSNSIYGGKLRFGTRAPGQSLNTRMVIDEFGRVGIGTTLPTFPLDVVGNVRTTGSITATSFSGSGAGLTSIPAANITGSVPTTDIPSDVRTRVITYMAGCDSCSTLATSDAQNAIFINQYTSLSILSVACYTDAGAPVVNVQRDHGGALSNVLGSDLTCSSTGASSASATTLSAADKLNFTITSVDNTTKRATIVIKARVN